jgi:hypothetical protein
MKLPDTVHERDLEAITTRLKTDRARCNGSIVDALERFVTKKSRLGCWHATQPTN